MKLIKIQMENEAIALNRNLSKEYLQQLELGILLNFVHPLHRNFYVMRLKQEGVKL